MRVQQMREKVRTNKYAHLLCSWQQMVVTVVTTGRQDEDEGWRYL